MPQIICPICDTVVKKSPYISNELRGDNDAIHVANLVTHYRYSHLKSYDYAWRNPRDKKTGYSRTGDHDEFRQEANKTAKRAILEVLRKDRSTALIKAMLRLADNDDEITAEINASLTT